MFDIRTHIVISDNTSKKNNNIKMNKIVSLIFYKIQSDSFCLFEQFSLTDTQQIIKVNSI